MKTIRCAVDRVEGDLLVLVSDEDKLTLHLYRREYPSLDMNDIVDLTLDGDRVVRVDAVEGEREARLKRNKEKLAGLFAKRKK